MAEMENEDDLHQASPKDKTKKSVTKKRSEHKNTRRSGRSNRVHPGRDKLCHIWQGSPP